MLDNRTFEYDTLPSEGHVRILELLPGQPSDHVRCVLRTQAGPLGEGSCRYNALSYAWGRTVKTQRITVNDCDFFLTESLLCALLHLRGPQSRFMWIDAICLNQDNVDEKSVHIKNMRDIYMFARGVHAWLGPQEAGSDIAMDFFTVFGEVLETQNHLVLASDTAQRAVIGILQDLRPHARRALDAALYALLDRTWWRRIWVQQEATMNPETSLHCGGKSVDIDIALQAVTAYLELVDIPGNAYADMLRIRDIRHLTFQIIENDIRDRVPPPISSACLIDMVRIFQKCQATEPRDKIVAAAAFSEGSASSVNNAYKLSVEDFFQRFAVEHLQMRYVGLGVLGYTGDFPDPTLPTWVPDWRDDTCIRTPLVKRIYTRRFSTYSGLRTYAAGLRSLVKGPPSQSFHVEGRLLKVGVVIIDTVADIFTIPSWHQLTPDRRTEWLSELPSTGYYGSSGKEMESAIRRTLVADMCFGPDDLPRKRGAELDWPGIDAHTLPSQQISGTSATLPETDQQYAFESATTGRKFAYTNAGYYALVPRTTHAGDKIAIFDGGQVLFVLRGHGSDMFSLIGESYVDGLMDGEALIGFSEDDWQWLTIR